MLNVKLLEIVNTNFFKVFWSDSMRKLNLPQDLLRNESR